MIIGVDGDRILYNYACTIKMFTTTTEKTLMSLCGEIVSCPFNLDFDRDYEWVYF